MLEDTWEEDEILICKSMKGIELYALVVHLIGFELYALVLYLASLELCILVCEILLEDLTSFPVYRVRVYVN